MQFKRSSLRASHEGQGFTLIELLVVMAIIGLLVALLMPSLAASRDSARSVQCLSRLRTMSTYQVMYREDYTQHFMQNRLWGTGISTHTFVGQMRPYLGDLADTHWSRRSDRNYLLCPSGIYVPPPTQSSGTIYTMTYIDSWRLTNYMQSAFFGYGNIGNVAQNYRWKRGIRHHESMVMQMTEIRSASPQVGYLGSYGMVIYPHPNRSANMLFVDGHARNMGPRTLPQQVNDTFIAAYSVAQRSTHWY